MIVRGEYTGTSKSKLFNHLKALILIGDPKIEIEEVTYLDALKRYENMNERLPFFKCKNGFLTKVIPDIGAEIIGRFMTNNSKENVYTLTLDAMGGVIDEIGENETAFVHRGDIRAWLLIKTQWSNQDDGPSQFDWINEFYERIAIYLSGRSYANMPDRGIEDHLESHYGSNLNRLVRIKKKYDPENVFSFDQSIPTSLEY